MKKIFSLRQFMPTSIITLILIFISFNSFAIIGVRYSSATNTITVCQDAGATDLKYLLIANDIATGATETWSQNSGGAPSHGTLVITGATASSGSSSITPGGTITYTPNSGYSGSDAFTIKLTNGTNTVTKTINVTVTASTIPTVSIDVDNNPVCAGNSVTFTATPGNATSPTYAWFKGITQIGTGSIYGSSSLANGDAITCVMTASNACGSSNNFNSNIVTMVVKPNHTITASASTGGSISNVGVTSICDGNDAPTYTITANSGYSIADVLVDGVSIGAVGTHTFTNVTADHTISASFVGLNTDPVFVGGANQSFTFCQDTSAIDLTPYISVNDADAGQTETYTVTYTTGSLFGTLTQGNTTVSSGTNVAPTGWYYQPNKGFAGNDQFILQVDDGNGGTKSTHVIIYVNPAPFLIIGGDSTGCGSVELLGLGDGPDYKWDGGNTPDSWNNTFSTSGLYTVTATGTNGCKASKSRLVTVLPTVVPTVSMVANTKDTIVIGTNVTFTATPTNEGTTPTYLWKINGGSAGTGNPFSYANLYDGDVVSVELTSTATCATPAKVTSNSITITVNNLPSFASGHNQDLTICHDEVIDFNTNIYLAINDLDINQTETYTVLSQPKHGILTVGATALSTGGGAQPNGWVYTPVAGYSGTDTFAIKVEDGVGGADTTQLNLVVTGKPNAGTISGPSTVCGSFGIADLTTDGDAGGVWTQSNIQSLYLDYYTGQAQGLPNNGATGTELQTITYTVQNTCGDTAYATYPLTVIFNAYAGYISGNSSPEICPGGTFNFFIVGGDSAGTWSSLDPTIATIDNKGNATALVEGTATIKYFVTNACSSDSTTNPLYIDHFYQPTVTITADNNPIAPGTNVWFNSSFNDEGSVAEFDWYKNGVLVSVNFTNHFDNTLVDGDSIYLVIKNGNACNNAASTQSNVIKMVVINPCVATTSSTTQSACGSYTWDGTTYTTSGDYTKHYTNACGSDSAATLHLTISAAPVNQSVVLSDCKSVIYNGVTYTKNATIYDTIKNGNGCDSVYKTINIYITFQAIISVDKNPTCNTQIATFTSKVYNANVLVYQWYKNGVAIVGATTASYTTAGTIAGDDIQLRVRSKSPLCSSKVNDTVWSNVIHFAGMSSAASKLTISTPTTSVCTGASVTYTATTTNAGSMAVYTWKVNGATVAQGKDTFYTSTTIANGDVVSCTLNTNNTCQVTNVINSNTITMTVNATTSVPVNAITGNTGICSIGGTTTLTETTVGGAWSSSDTKVATVNASGVVTATGTGTTTIKYTVGTGVCGTNASVDVAVAPIKMLPITGPTTVCQGNSVQLANATVGKGVWSVVNARGTITPGGLLKGTAAGGNAIVQFAVTNSAGCSSKAYLNVAVTAPCALQKELPKASDVVPITKLSIYPNPARGVVTVSINNYELKINNGTQLTITDMAGKVLKTQTVTEKQTKVNINGMKPGMYLVTMQSAEGKTTEKLMVE